MYCSRVEFFATATFTRYEYATVGGGYSSDQLFQLLRPATAANYIVIQVQALKLGSVKLPQMI